ncbi:MAG: LamG-like jellyroll fold domain-containing protein [Candidatus Paceibacterota bacterium]|jgi:type II secretory pathway pseudopilin PulG
MIRENNSFTLVELLVVIGILAVLTTAVIIVLNPTEFLSQSRDSRRMNDLSLLNNSLQNLEAIDPTISFGTPLTVYVSIPDDASSTCGTLGLPNLPSGYTYNCVSTANLTKTNGTGWVPVNFTTQAVIQLSALAIDPTNTASTGNYYTYTPGGSWELTTALESNKFKLGGSNDKASTDGGQFTGLFETGTNKTLTPIDYGDTSLIAHYKFENNIIDYSGNNNTGTWGGTGTHYVAGKVGSYAGQFNSGNGDYISTGSNDFATMRNATISFWVNGTTQYYRVLFSNLARYSGGYAFGISADPNKVYFANGNSVDYITTTTLSNVLDNTWHFITGVVNTSSGKTLIYADGQLSNSVDSGTVSNGRSNFMIANDYTLYSGNFPTGLIDDFRVYNRAFSASEILALYNATK